MAFTPEDGTGVAGANAYGTVAGFRDYHTDRGRVADSGTIPDNVVQQRLILAADYIETRWGQSFKGYPVSVDQGLHFPAYGVVDRHGRTYDSDAVPIMVEFAAYEYAFRADVALYNEVTVDATGVQVTGVREKVGPIETETQYAEGGSVSTIKPIPAADRLLLPLLKGGGAAVRA